MEVKTIKLMNGGKRWQSCITLPIELMQDESFVRYQKEQLKEMCVKQYIDNVEDSFSYNIQTNRNSPYAEMIITMEDLFGLKDQNKRLRKELRELVDKYMALKHEITAR